MRISGYASVFGTPYEISDRDGKYVETIEPGAFTSTLASHPDVALLVNHKGLPLARTVSGTLRLAQDETGLHVDATLDPSDPDVRSILPKLQRGDVSEMSFAFRATSQQWSEDYTRRRILAANLDRGDVSIVTFGANASTTVAARTDGDDTTTSTAKARRERAERIGDRVTIETRSERVGDRLVIQGASGSGLKVARAPRIEPPLNTNRDHLTLTEVELDRLRWGVLPDAYPPPTGHAHLDRAARDIHQWRVRDLQSRCEYAKWRARYR